MADPVTRTETGADILCVDLVRIFKVFSGAGQSVEVQALQGLNLRVARGELVAVIGASGSGKSTLLSILSSLDQPSAGVARVAVVSPDPTTKPFIVHNYFAEPADMRSAIAGLRTVVEIGQAEPLAGLTAAPHMAPASLSDADLEAHIRARTQTIYHPTSTCRMGVDELAVTDAELRVRGVEGLRVVDASVFPSVPRGNTNAPTIALAERAADLIRGRTPERTGAAAASAAAR